MPKRKRQQDQDGLYRRGDSPYWWASFTDASGTRVRRSTGASQRQEAQALLAKWKLAAYQERQWGAEPSHTFDELMIVYLRDTAGQRRSEETVKMHVRRLRQHFAGVEMESLSGAGVVAYSRERLAQEVSTSTVNRELEVLSAAINYAVKVLEWHLPNPVGERMLKEPEGRLRWLTREEAKALVRAAGVEPKAPYLAPLVVLALHTGMRRGELLGLEWDRVDLKARQIYLEARHTKAAKRRTVPLNTVALDAIMTQDRYRTAQCPGSPWVFCDERGSSIASVQRSFGTACRRADIQDFRFHDLRHTCAAWLVQAGVSLAQVRDVLGHSTITMTERYAHLAPENARSALAAIEGGESRFSHVGDGTIGEKTA